MCEFKVFLQKSNLKKISKKGGVTLGECSYDLSPYATEKPEEDLISFEKKTKGVPSKFSVVQLSASWLVNYTDKPIDPSQFATRDQSMAMSEDEARSLDLLLNKQKELMNLKDSPEKKITDVVVRNTFQDFDQIEKIDEDEEMKELFGDEACAVQGEDYN